MSTVEIQIVNRTSDQHRPQVVVYQSRPHGDETGAATPAYEVVELGPDEIHTVTVQEGARYFVGLASAGPGELHMGRSDALELAAGQTAVVTGSVGDGLHIAVEAAAR